MTAIRFLLFVVLSTFAMDDVFAQCANNGEPDVFYTDRLFPVGTSAGAINRPIGTVILDTDGTDIVSVRIGGPDVTDLLAAGHLHNGGFLPDPNAPPFNVSVWSVDYLNGAMQWQRTQPLTTDGFRGVIGEYDDVVGLFPDYGLADYGAENADDFERVFEDDEGMPWEVVLETNAGEVFYTNVRNNFASYLDPDTYDDSYSVSRGGTIDSAVAGLPSLLNNDFDDTCAQLEASHEVFEYGKLRAGLAPSHGEVVISPDGSFVYTHDGSSALTDTFSYFAVDPDSFFDRWSEGFVTINVVPEPSMTFLWLTGMALISRRKLR